MALRESGPLRPSPRRTRPDILCLSHLRWDFVFQRPQHLLSRAARDRRVHLVEEPVFDAEVPRLEMRVGRNGVNVAVPHLVPGTEPGRVEEQLREMVDGLVATARLTDFVLWYYTPMATGFTDHLHPRAVVYDVMDELSLFRGAPPLLVEREAALFERADVVFTGGASLFAAKRHRHSNVHLFPSSIDADHFAVARLDLPDPADQASLPRPRLGFFGVIDERMDLELLASVADARPEWHLVMVGPVVKIDPAELPRRPNIHFVGARDYDDLPRYIAGWDVALMPWALNDSTRFISPTKTPEYLAAGRPVVSTAVRDVVEPYGTEGLVRIAHSPSEFIRHVELALQDGRTDRAVWLERVDARLANTSWDRTWTAMSDEIDRVVQSLRDPIPLRSRIRSAPAAAAFIEPQRAAAAAD